MVDYVGVRKLADFLLLNTGDSGVAIDADDVALLALEIQQILARVDKLEAINVFIPTNILGQIHRE